jgi:fatty acid desaturase
MTTDHEELELKDRLSLIESMIAEGRRTTESWGWTFVLWGVAYYIAIFWATWGHGVLAWPVTMTSGVALTMFIGIRKGRKQPGTRIGRAIASLWMAMGISMMLLFPALGISGRMDPHSFVALVAAMLGTTNAASSLILKWKAQFACAVVWWAATVAACFGSLLQLLIVFLAAIFLCQIVFGIYAMISEARQQRPNGQISGKTHLDDCHD